MLKRVITGIIAFGILIPVLIFSDTVVLPAALAVIAVISVYELIKCFGYEKNWALSLPLYVITACVPFFGRYYSLIGTWMDALHILTIAGIVYVIYLFALIIWSHGKLPFGDTMAMLLMTIYTVMALTSIVFVRDFKPGGQYIYLLIFIGAWITDTFAYFTGYFFGKHKLIEDVSPKKTIEGSIGGTVFCALSFLGFGLVTKFCFHEHTNFLFLAICGVVVALISQIGDLIMSVIKRHYGIKDFGKIFPGHGGVLDRFDSILAVSLGMCAICMFVQLTGIPLIGYFVKA